MHEHVPCKNLINHGCNVSLRPAAGAKSFLAPCVPLLTAVSPEMTETGL